MSEGQVKPASHVLEVLRLNSELEVLRAGIRAHRDARGDDRCWLDDVTLYQLLPEGFKPEKLDSFVELERCKQFIACRQNPATEYVSPQRRIEALIEVVKRFGCHSVDCIPGFPCSCGAEAALQAAGLDEAEVWK